MNIPVPARATAAVMHAQAEGFQMSSDPAVGELLRTLAAAVPPGGRILEIGTGTGFGTAWLVDGLGERTDVDVLTIDVDAQQVADVESRGWPPYVTFAVGDGLEVLARSGTFDLVFADAPAGKTSGLDRTIASVRPRGVLVVDDMAALPDGELEVIARQERVRAALFAAPELVAVELAQGSGVILATKQATVDLTAAEAVATPHEGALRLCQALFDDAGDPHYVGTDSSGERLRLFWNGPPNAAVQQLINETWVAGVILQLEQRPWSLADLEAVKRRIMDDRQLVSRLGVTMVRTSTNVTGIDVGLSSLPVSEIGTAAAAELRRLAEPIPVRVVQVNPVWDARPSP